MLIAFLCEDDKYLVRYISLEFRGTVGLEIKFWKLSVSSWCLKIEDWIKKFK